MTTSCFLFALSKPEIKRSLPGPAGSNASGLALGGIFGARALGPTLTTISFVSVFAGQVLYDALPATFQHKYPVVAIDRADGALGVGKGKLFSGTMIVGYAGVAIENQERDR